MKVIVTGSLGNVSRPLTQELVKKGHEVIVISSKAEKQPAIEALGASAAIGSVENIDFLTHTFTNADIVYCMIPPVNFMDKTVNIRDHYSRIAGNYKEAILRSGVKKIIHLSSVGGDMEKDNGMLVFHHDVETILKDLPSDVAITTIRPVSFFTNLFAFIPAIKARGVIQTNYGGDDVCPWVSPNDIAAAIADEIDSCNGRKFRYVASEEISCNKIAEILGAAIGKPDLQWNICSDHDALAGLLSAGINEERAKGVVEMNANIHNGKLQKHYSLNKPELGKTKLSDFAAGFAKAYNS